MSSGLIIGLEMALVLGVVLGLAVWELVRLRRDRARDRKTAPAPRAADGAPPRAADGATPRAADDAPPGPP